MTSRFSRAMIAFALICASHTAHAQTELRITHAFASGTNKDVLDEIIVAFEAANPDIRIRQIVFDDDIYSDTGLITQLQNTEVPDIYFQWAGRPLRRDVDAGFAFDLSAAMASDGWKETFSPSLWAQGGGLTVDGKPYMVPLSIDVTNTIWYNSTIFARNGLTPPKTWEDFVEICKALVTAGETPIVIGNNELWPLGNWASHIAARVVPPAQYDAAFRQEAPFGTPDFERAFDRLAQLHEIGAFNKDLAGLGADPAMATFFQEGAVMHPIGSWLIASTTELAEDGFAYAQFDTPIIEDTHPLKDSIIGTATGFVLHAKSTKHDEAVRFLKFFTNEANQIKWAESGALSPVKGVNAKARLDEHTRSINLMLEQASSIVPPPDTAYPVPVAEAYYQAVALVAGGRKTPKEALEWLDQTVKTIGKP